MLQRWRGWLTLRFGWYWFVVGEGQLRVLITELVLHLAEVSFVHLGRFVRRG